MDYYFHLSDPDETRLPTVLRPNFIMASRAEPCNAGFFMVQPGMDKWEKLQNIIELQQQSGLKIPYPHFDRENGWGHNFLKSKDKWEGILQSGTLWNYHAVHSDQGLLYQYAKYDIQDVSIAIGNRLQTWVPNDEEGGLPIKESDVPGVLAEFSPKPVAYQFSCDRKGKTDKDSDFNCHPPSCDFAHFMGTMKPWQKKVTLPFMDEHNTYERNAPFRLWFEELARLNDEHDMKLDLQNWNEVHLEGMKTAPLGVMAKWVDQALMVKRKYGIPPRGGFTVAYAVSFIKCGDFQTNAAG
eukprot:CAMPEP_0113326900 /NCGR_PEP_ID=MMETSP0010_2-20120614/18871_1 /TAXON_ID=216773 ORGANISM="Corethron hystrix, Strain 308" /NCGR_SAMPLE_ID=MMETSP0010_2 /ASSEMBLY_ACC=CAM_ASM_000155 /LENGTH=296 /DNA_ID=CAMNT_0000187469 /DNA_START=220 /DNA_END=1106 /DNA_ORIENTATION=- /assembly_acc=CAM_ASM_000155